MTTATTELTVKRLAPGLYQVGPVAVSRECEDWSCGCDRYAIRPHFGDPLAEMGDWITARRLLKDALAVAEEYAKEMADTATADYIATHNRDYRAWLSQVTVFGLPTDDAAFIAWRETLEAQERDRMRAMLAR